MCQLGSALTMSSNTAQKTIYNIYPRHLFVAVTALDYYYYCSIGVDRLEASTPQEVFDQKLIASAQKVFQRHIICQMEKIR